MENVAFRVTSDPVGLEIRDRVSRCRVSFATSTRPEPTTADADAVPFPVERACRITTDRIELDHRPGVLVRDERGDLLDGLYDRRRERYPEGDHYVELAAAVKIYLHVPGPLAVRVGTDTTELAFDGPVEVTVAARARLDRPTCTVTTTTDLDDLRRAVETQSAALRTRSPERSFPTLRGHPPRIRLGDELSIPNDAEPAEPAAEIGVRRRLDDLLTVAPLVHYLPASLSFTDAPRVAVGGKRRPLDDGGFGADSFAGAVERALKHVLILDCLVRKRGSYPLEVADVEPIAREREFDLDALYGAAPAERLASYLEVPTELTVPRAPRWPAVAYVEPTADAVELLPYLADDLALVRTSGVERHAGDDARRVALARFVGDDRERVRGTSTVFGGGETFVDVPETTAHHQLWVGDGVPLNANAALAAGYEHRHRREPTEDRHIEVIVVCNDHAMVAEATAVEDRYASAGDPSFDVETHRDVTADRLRTLFERDADFLHYVGHATADGLGCSDGWLQAADLPDVGVDVFFLNACQSYRQGCGLVEAGAVGGVVTLGDVNDDAAVETGTLVARLLDRGFPVADALAVAGRESVVGGQYVAVGDTSARVTKPHSGIANTSRVETTDDGYRLWNTQLFSHDIGVGGMGTMHAPGWSELRLCGEEAGPVTLDADDLREFFAMQDVPVWFDGDLRWSGELARDGLPD